jgi:hypothetical protein
LFVHLLALAGSLLLAFGCIQLNPWGQELFPKLQYDSKPPVDKGGIN